MESLLVQLVTVAEPADEFTVMSLLSKASPVVQAALVVLVLMSVISWYIIVYKWIYFRRATKDRTSSCRRSGGRSAWTKFTTPVMTSNTAR